MYLSKQAFKLRVSQTEAVSILESFLKSKNWLVFEVGTPKLFLVPFWFFSYDIYLQGKGSAASSHSKGRLALNAFINELSENVALLVERSDFELSNKIDAEQELEVKKPKVKEAEAREIAALRVASMNKAAPQNVVLSAFELFYVPIWSADISVDGLHYLLQVNAVNGSVLKGETISSREPNLSETIHETVKELRDPASWLQYIKGFFSTIFSAISTREKLPTVLLLLALLIVLLWFVGFF